MGTTAAAKTYRASNLAEALASVKQEMGPNAVILSARRLRSGGLLGLGRAMLEVQATPPRRVEQKDRPKADDQPRRVVNFDEIIKLKKSLSDMNAEIRMSRLETSRGRDDLESLATRVRDDLRNTASVLRSVIAQAHLSHKTGLPDAQVEAIRRLVENGVEPGNAEAIVRASPQDSNEIDTVMRAVAGFLLDQLHTSRPLQTSTGRRVAAFVGPTGVGKTTTIAKIAATCLIAGRRVGLVTTDTYRIGAVTQLEGYAECMQIPIKQADSPMALRSAIQDFSNRHVVLVDTGGVSHRDSQEIARLSALLSRAWISEVHLTLSASTGYDDLARIQAGFRRIGVDHVIVTKLDESSSYGLLFNAPVLFGAPLSYLCAGQRVPENIEVATPERAARLIMADHESKRRG